MATAPTPTALATQAELELHVTPNALARYLDDDGDGEADARPTEQILLRASQEAKAHLLPAFSTDQIEGLAAADPAIRGAVLDIAADLMARRRPALLTADGKTPYTGWRDQAEAYLKSVAKGEARSAAEESAGLNQNLAVTVNIDPVDFSFARTADRKTGRGGF